jgi:hypothetical protein
MVSYHVATLRATGDTKAATATAMTIAMSVAMRQAALSDSQLLSQFSRKVDDERFTRGHARVAGELQFSTQLLVIDRTTCRQDITSVAAFRPLTLVSVQSLCSYVRSTGPNGDA